MNGTAWRAMQHFAEAWAKSLGCAEGGRTSSSRFRLRAVTYDPSRLAVTCRTALRQILTAAGVQISFYSFRHHAITKLLENPDVSDETVEAIAGHVSERMKKRRLLAYTLLHVKRGGRGSAGTNQAAIGAVCG